MIRTVTVLATAPPSAEPMEGLPPAPGAPEPFGIRLHRTLATLRPPRSAPTRASTRTLLAGLAVLSTVSLLGTIASPALFDHPAVLVALAPRLPFLALAATDVPLLPFLVLGAVRLCLADPLHFLLGRRYGPTVVRKLVGRRRWLERIAGGSSLVAVAVRPIGRHLLLAGAAGARARHVAIVDAAGTLVYLALLHAAARAVAG